MIRERTKLYLNVGVNLIIYIFSRIKIVSLLIAIFNHSKRDIANFVLNRVIRVFLLFKMSFN